MANSSQARKRVRQNVSHRARNASRRSSFRTAIKKVDAAIQSGDYESASAAYTAAVPVIDRMKSIGLIHPNKAARHKSRLNAKVKVLKK